MRILTVARKQGEWILFLEDLEQRGHTLVQTDSCQQGRRTFEADPLIDLLIVENFPSDPCVETFLHWARNDHRTSGIPVIVAGSTFSEDDIGRYLRLQVTDLLVLPANAASLDAKLTKAIRQGKPKVLVVDDDEAIGGLLKDLLEMQRFHVDTVLSAHDALTHLGRHPVDVVVSDIMMPGMRGDELMVEIKTHYPHIPVILMTGFAGRTRPEDLISAGADGFFAKPFNNRELVFTLRRVLDQRRNRPAPAPAPHQPINAD